jgi:tetratricopeptide (TPR) repeat protein
LGADATPSKETALTSEHSENGLRVPPGDILGKFIMLRDWHGAIAEVADRLERAEGERKRGFYHLFLATLYKMVVKGAKRRRQEADVDKYRELAEGAYRESLAIDPDNLTARLSAAEFFLRHRGDATAAIGLLGPIAETDYSSHLSMTQQEHKRRALLGGAHAMRGEVDEAKAWFIRAYGDAEFQRDLNYSYNMIFWTLMAHRVRLPGAMLDETLEHLKAFRNYRPRNVARFREELAQ